MSEVLKRKSSLYLKIIWFYQKIGSTEAVPDYYKLYERWLLFSFDGFGNLVASWFFPGNIWEILQPENKLWTITQVRISQELDKIIFSIFCEDYRERGSFTWKNILFHGKQKQWGKKGFCSHLHFEQGSPFSDGTCVTKYSVIGAEWYTFVPQRLQQFMSFLSDGVDSLWVSNRVCSRNSRTLFFNELSNPKCFRRYVEEVWT